MGNWVQLNTTPYVVVFWSIQEVVVVAVGLKFTDLVDLIWFIVLNATFSNISAISWRPGLVVQDAGNPGENYRYLVLCVVFVDQHLSYCPISLDIILFVILWLIYASHFLFGIFRRFSCWVIHNILYFLCCFCKCG